MTSKNFSLLSDAMVRELPVALAHSYAVTKPSAQERMEMLNRVYLSLAPIDQLKCRAELRRCKQAQRGELEAIIG